jgi:hypothetical protein
VSRVTIVQRKCIGAAHHRLTRLWVDPRQYVERPDCSRAVVASYREYASPPGLSDVVACLWENHGVRDRPQLVIPDGGVDLVWFGAAGLKVVGAPRLLAG